MQQRQEGGENMEEKRIEAQWAKPRTPTLAIDALIGDEEPMRKRRGDREKSRSGPPAQLSGTCHSPPTTCRYHTASLLL